MEQLLCVSKIGFLFINILFGMLYKSFRHFIVIKSYLIFIYYRLEFNMSARPEGNLYKVIQIKGQNE